MPLSLHFRAPECEFHGTFTGPQTFLFCFFSLFEMEKTNTPHSWLTGPYQSSPAGDSEERSMSPTSCPCLVWVVF